MVPRKKSLTLLVAVVLPVTAVAVLICLEVLRSLGHALTMRPICTASTEKQMSPGGGGLVEVRHAECDNGWFLTKNRRTYVRVGVTRRGGITEDALIIEGKHRINSAWPDPHHVVIICYDLRGGEVTYRRDGVTVDAGGVGETAPETISITYDLK